MTFYAVRFLAMVCMDINLEYHIYGSGRIDIMASSAKLPATFLSNIPNLWIFNMASSRSMTDQTGKTRMHFAFELFLNI